MTSYFKVLPVCINSSGNGKMCIGPRTEGLKHTLATGVLPTGESVLSIVTLEDWQM